MSRAMLQASTKRLQLFKATQETLITAQMALKQKWEEDQQLHKKTRAERIYN